jgi:predicted DNA binding CopG/RHH family protein
VKQLNIAIEDEAMQHAKIEAARAGMPLYRWITELILTHKNSTALPVIQLREPAQ